MTVLINFTPKPMTVTGTGAPSLKESIEVQGVREARFALRVLGGSFTAGSMQFEVALEGNMVLEDYGWATMVTFPVVSDAPLGVSVTLDKPLRYLRWKVIDFTNATKVLFQIDGLGWE